MIRTAFAAAVACVLLLFSSSALAAVSYNDLEDELMCVSCNVPLNIAESPQAAQQKEELRKLIDSGLTKKQVMDRMVGIYGENVLAEPEGKGFALFAWVVPIGAALALIALGIVLLPRWRERRRGGDDDDGDAGPDLDPADAARVDADMARLGV